MGYKIFWGLVAFWFVLLPYTFADEKFDPIIIPETISNDANSDQTDEKKAQEKEVSPDSESASEPKSQEGELDAALPDERFRLAEDARMLAKKILKTSFQKWTNNTFKKAIVPLNKAKILWPKQGKDFEGCEDHVLAFVLPKVSLGKIFMCNYASKQALKSRDAEKFIAQLLIHESAHLAGYYDECHASIVELGAMAASSENLMYKNGYLKRCRLQ